MQGCTTLPRPGKSRQGSRQGPTTGARSCNHTFQVTYLNMHVCKTWPSYCTQPALEGVKDGVLLELGFDDTTPNVPLTISSWAWDAANNSAVKL